ncbi:hypothetical protein Ae201684P_009560 [Aphanomyces euteiches]|nr:hypothetical protein Ae201684P_009560 [Aphanomyces euteiches]
MPQLVDRSDAISRIHRQTARFLLHGVIEMEGRRAYVRAMQSIQLAGVPDLDETYGIVRADVLHNGFIFIETDRPNILELISLYHNRPNGQVRGALGDILLGIAVKGHYRTIEDTERVIRAYQLSRLTLFDQFSLPPLHLRTKCELCFKTFGNSQKSHCRHCTRIICPRQCSTEWNLVKAGLKIRVRICVACSNHVGRLPASEFSTPRDPSESIISLSFADDFSSHYESEMQRKRSSLNSKMTLSSFQNLHLAAFSPSPELESRRSTTKT